MNTKGGAGQTLPTGDTNPVIPSKRKYHQAILLTILGFVITAGLVAVIVVFTSISKRPIYIYLLVISLTGGFGGLCSSLIENGGLILTHLRPIQRITKIGDKKAPEDSNIDNPNPTKQDKTDNKINNLAESQYKVEFFPGLYLGTVGDTLIGIASAFGVFFVLSGLVTIKNNFSEIELSAIFVLAGMGVIAGAAGKSIIKALVLKMKDMVDAKDTANAAAKNVEDAQKAIIDVHEKAKTLETKTTQNEEKAKNDHQISLDALDLSLTSAGHALVDAKKLDKAEETFNKALELNKDSFRALVGLGRVRKRQNDLSAAIDLCNQALKIRPNYALAYYNKACYESLLPNPVIDQIIIDLKTAIGLDIYYLNTAKADSDFDAIKDNLEFKKLLGIA
jgi:tetratricopeptide (TPR) repeat protein